MTSYILKPGTYYVGDIALIAKKTPEANKMLDTLWKIFYEHPNDFQLINLNKVEIFITRTLGGDGIFNGIGTDTGTIVIINTDQIKNNVCFKQDLKQGHFKYLTYEYRTVVKVEAFNIFFEDFEIITQ